MRLVCKGARLNWTAQCAGHQCNKIGMGLYPLAKQVPFNKKYCL